MMRIKNKTKFFNISLIGVSLFLILILVLFLNTNGFFADIYSYDGNDIHYSNEYMSSGGNDDGVAGAFIIVRFLLCFISLFIISSRIPFVFYILAWFFELFGLMLISDTSDVFKTVYYNRVFSIWFFTWLLSIPFSIFVYLKLPSVDSATEAS